MHVNMISLIMVYLEFACRIWVPVKWSKYLKTFLRTVTLCVQYIAQKWFSSVRDPIELVCRRMRWKRSMKKPQILMNLPRTPIAINGFSDPDLLHINAWVCRMCSPSKWNSPMKKYATLNFLRTVSYLDINGFHLPIVFIRLQDTVPVEVVESTGVEVPNPDELPKPEDSNCMCNLS